MKFYLLLALFFLLGIGTWLITSGSASRPAINASANASTNSSTAIPAVTPDETIVASQLGRNQLLQIQWGVTPEAPFHIAQGPDQGNGFCDVLLQRLAVYLPDVRQERLLDSHANIRLRMQQHQQVCFPCTLFKPETATAQARIYSEPTHFYRPHGVVVRKAAAKSFIEKFGSPIDLVKLLQSDYRYSFPAARRFGDLQPLIDQYSKNYLAIPDAKNSQDIFRLVDQSALDFSIDYQSALTYYNRSEQHQLIFLPIAGQPQLLAGAISCPDTNWGQLAIFRINKVVEKLREDPQLLENLRFWQGSDLPAYQSELATGRNAPESP